MQLLDDLKEKRGLCNFRGEALKSTQWRISCGEVINLS